MLKGNKKMIVLLLTATMLTSTGITAIAASDDGWTEASQTEAAKNGAWETWVNNWETIKQNPTQMSLTPGRNATELNFGWYSKDGEAAPQLKIGKKQNLSDAENIDVATNDVPANDYSYNHATATGLEENATYYYSYTVNGEWTPATIYKTHSTDRFSFLLVGDPQIGSSSGNTATGASEAQGQDYAVRNDSFNWNNTINTALAKNPNVSFMISAGDQIQTTSETDTEKQDIEYAGYLSPEALKSLPVATTIGNHDSKNANYTYHFNNPNASDKGTTDAGGDYYYSYGNTLFIDLNTNSENWAEHEQIVQQAISENPDAKWRVVTLHHDIYGPGEHSNEPEIINKRYNLTPILEDNKIDVVLTGHDHTYSRSYMLKDGVRDEAKELTDDEFGDEFDKELAGKETSQKYKDYLESIKDPEAVQDVTLEDDTKTIANPTGILYMTADSASGSKYYDLVKNQQAYVAARWQEDIPTYSTVDIDNESFTINTYRTDNGEKIDKAFTIVKSDSNAETLGELNKLIESGNKLAASSDEYTKASIDKLNAALAAAGKVNSASSSEEIADAYADLSSAIKDIQTRKDIQTKADNANALLEDTKDNMGTGDNQYKQEKADALKDAITNANEKALSSESSPYEVKEALEALDEAVENFKAGDYFKFYPLAVLAGLSAAALLFINKKRKLLGRLK